VGRRSRKRGVSPAGRVGSRDSGVPRGSRERSPASDRPLRPARRGGGRRGGRGDPPPAPWGRFPLVELCVLLALVIGVAGFVVWGEKGRIMLACAAALGSLAGLELSIREHFAGYRSHSTVLAGTLAVAALAVMFFARLPQAVLLVVGAAVFATAFWALREFFKRRSGGFGWR
jgi:hypothetical protein